jgi:AraC-like DNA-binding protein
MHDEPARDWTVEELGQRAGVSRSTFALRFKETVGVSPMEYLTRWRMLLARDRMANTSDSISEIAWSLGYESASAFTKKPLRKSRAVRRGQKSPITISGHTEAQSLPELAFECEST